MGNFHYVALDKDQQRVTGTVSAPDRPSALRILSTNYPVITALDDGRPGWRSRMGLRLGVGNEELVVFTQTLATLLQAGMTLRASLDLLARELKGPAMNAVLVQLSRDLGEGQTFTQALANHPQVFSKFYRSLTLAGETGGSLPEVLTMLGDYLARNEATRDRLRGAAVYPLLVFTFAVLMATLLVMFAVPQLESMYSGLSARLPAPTQFLIDMSRFLGAHWLAVSLGLAVLVGGVNLGLSTRPGTLLVDRLKLGFGPTRTLYAHLYTARFTYTLGTLYSAGVPMLRALEILAETLENRVLERRVHQIIEEVKDGSSLALALHKHQVVTDIAGGLIEAGEESGQLEPILRRLAAYYQSKFDNSLAALVSLAEPVMIILVGVIVGGLVIALGLPFANLVTVLS